MSHIVRYAIGMFYCSIKKFQLLWGDSDGLSWNKFHNTTHRSALCCVHIVVFSRLQISRVVNRIRNEKYGHDIDLVFTIMMDLLRFYVVVYSLILPYIRLEFMLLYAALHTAVSVVGLLTLPFIFM